MNKTQDDLRRQYKKETGDQFGSALNDKRNSPVWFRDEYVEWLEEELLKRLNEEA